mmetsp:Transcript_14161/g.23572  ORF Transcript_14161/g.23572 Transcript_14161/m.23572 type:complete len:88 (-) Transcript_14161:9-272(-)
MSKKTVVVTSASVGLPFGINWFRKSSMAGLPTRLRGPEVQDTGATLFKVGLATSLLGMSQSFRGIIKQDVGLVMRPKMKAMRLIAFF